MATQTDTKRYVENLRSRIKEKRQELGGGEEFYRTLYGKNPVDLQSQTLINLVNRGSLKAEFLALCAEKFGWQDVTLGEIFSLPASEGKTKR